ncbi:MAG TPA: VWA domain-containing protein [Pyrinomonadaceae bacterium]
MKRLSLVLLVLPLALFTAPAPPAAPQSRPRTVSAANGEAPPPKDVAVAVRPDEEVVKVDVDLVVLDAIVLQKKTGRVVGDLKREDFVLAEDGVVQQITQFSQNSLPLSVLLVIDRGGCLDPFGENVRRAARDAVSRLKPADEVGVMAYHDSVDLVQEFTRDRREVADALDRVPGHDEEADHCLEKAFYEAARYMVRAGNPVGRRVIVVITGVTSNFHCVGAPSVGEAKREVYESGSVVCGIIPRTAGQRMESGMMRGMTGIAGAVGVPTIRVNDLADETGGEVLDDKPELLDRTFDTLFEHLRTRYQLAFVPTNRKHDGTVRKLKLKLTPAAEKSRGKLAVKTRRTYVAPKS